MRSPIAGPGAARHNGSMADRSWVRGDAQGARLVVWVVPGASREDVVGVHGDALKVRVTAPAERGKATEAVRKLLARRLRTDVELVSGGSSRRKIFAVRGLADDEVALRLGLEAGRGSRGPG